MDKSTGTNKATFNENVQETSTEILKKKQIIELSGEDNKEDKLEETNRQITNMEDDSKLNKMKKKIKK